MTVPGYEGEPEAVLNPKKKVRLVVVGGGGGGGWGGLGVVLRALLLPPAWHSCSCGLRPTRPAGRRRRRRPCPQVFESVQPDFSTDEQRRACYKGVPWATSAGPCTVPSVVGATIK